MIEQKKISRRAFLSCAGLAGVGVAAYTRFIEPEWLEVGRHQISIPSGAAGNSRPIKLLHLSDLHASWTVSLEYIHQAIELGLQTRPDVICVTGDFVTKKFSKLGEYGRILARLREAAPTFASLGNHDGGNWSQKYGGYATVDEVMGLVKESGLNLLHNRRETARVQGRAMEFIGLADSWAGDFDAGKAFGKSAREPGAIRVALSHNPDTKELLASYDWDLMLSGHTHGGQFYLPLIGAPFAPVKDRRFIAGMYEWNNRRIHVTKGIGNVWGLRFNCRPEVSLITIV